MMGINVIQDPQDNKLGHIFNISLVSGEIWVEDRYNPRSMMRALNLRTIKYDYLTPVHIDHCKMF